MGTQRSKLKKAAVSAAFGQLSRSGVMTSVIQIGEVHYPESDGKPIGETDDHRHEMIRHIELLQHYFLNQRVYVSGNLLVYYEQGNPRKFVVPDMFVAKDVSPDNRRVFKTWVERKVPAVVIETTSRKTRRKDTQDKPELYARLGVKEYFLFDCLQEYLDPPLQGQRLVGSAYQPIPADETGAIVSEELNLKLRREDGCLQFYRLDTGERLLTGSERADREEQARRAAEEELAKLRAELNRRK
jgi:hypothetical protein